MADRRVVDGGLDKALTGRSRQTSIKNSTCVICGGDANHFRDERSRTEYGISGMCQKCQDKVFGK